MLRIVEAFSPDSSPVVITQLACSYQEQKGGVYASVEFVVPGRLSDAASRGKKREQADTEGVEAVEFTFVLLDLFDNFLTSIQGIAGPGRYSRGRKKHKARWLFEIEGGFGQYHALCFPSQVRLLDGQVWRCDRDECIGWVNSRLDGTGVMLTEEDVFPEDAAHEGIRE